MNRPSLYVSRALALLVAAVVVPIGIRASAAGAKRTIEVTVSAPRHSYHNALVELDLPRGFAAKSVTIVGPGGRESPAQVLREGDKSHLAFVVSDLARGASAKYRVKQGGRPNSGVAVTSEGGDVLVKCGGALFTRYNTHGPGNKPYFYPILTPEGGPMTRRWPNENVPGESRDHPHHRGLWYTHGSVNGVDFWSVGTKAGKTICTGTTELFDGPLLGGFRSQTEWRVPDGSLIATDTRTVRVAQLPNGDRIMDFEVTLSPNGGPLKFGDTKEGSFGLRVPDKWMPIKGGHLVNSDGKRDTALWGKPANWVDYYGDVNGQTYGIAIFDAATNLRHPETWHARDYGLFAVNPFGLHDFGQGAPGAGDYTVDAGKTIAFQYRLLFHRGDTDAAAVADQYAAYADPPEVTVKR